MIAAMARGSLAVLARPSVATFEAHERERLGWAMLYVLAGAALSGVLSALGYTLKAASVREQLETLRGQVSGIEAMNIDLRALAGQPSLAAAVTGDIVGALIGFGFFVAVVYLFGRWLGGRGRIGALAYDIALFWAPLAVLQELLAAVAIGPLVALGGIATVGVAVYSLFLTYLGVQAGMDLPNHRAAAVVLVLVAVATVVVALLTGILVALMSGAASWFM